MEMDRPQLADFLRRRREALSPEDVGLPRGPRRRTTGLRREEVALKAAMSTDYYTRLEQQRGPQPSESMLSAIARALRLTWDERDHLFRLAGHTPPARTCRCDYVNPALMRVLDRLDTPAKVTTDLGETLAMNAIALAVFGDLTRFEGLESSVYYRWFAHPEEERAGFDAGDHERMSRSYVAGLRIAMARNPRDPRGLAIVDALNVVSDEFRALWEAHDVAPSMSEQRKHVLHPEVGMLDLQCQTLINESEAQMLLVYTATPGTETAEKLKLLGVIGTERFGSVA
jgi:transcriptional regulator with XRE-family HTH domain